MATIDQTGTGKPVLRQTTRFAITENPRRPEEASAVVGAVNALDALDQYAVLHGYGRYSDLPDLHGYLGFDEHGLWAVYENVTLWAIPLWSTKIARLRHEGIHLAVTRNEYTGQLFVQVNTEGLADRDRDSNLEPYVEIMLDEVVLYDHDKERRIQRGADMQWLVGTNTGEGYQYGVVAEHKDGKRFELHGFFPTYDDADTRRTYLETAYEDYGYVKVVKIELLEVSS